MTYVLGYTMSAEEKAAFPSLNPMGRYPVLVEEGQPPLWEADAIVCRLSALTGSDFWRTDASQPDMVRWISWATHHLNRAADPVYFSRVVMPQFTQDRLPEAEIAQGLADWAALLPILDAHLGGREWLLGDRLSYADFRAATALPFASAAGLPLDDAPNVRRWAAQLDRIDAWRDPFAGI
ncbi:glutathione S-transferase family protein [Limimaricola sp.]|uniref:glutathione S-transferase family protein n=1 Tax=Limimaricola sp. TaxID=2211665 RepID=UPI0025BDC687|nr:glutathione S-transferase family protein [Limimaricola sp.]